MKVMRIHRDNNGFRVEPETHYEEEQLSELSKERKSLTAQAADVGSANHLHPSVRTRPKPASAG
jgi:hypothetical protein